MPVLIKPAPQAWIEVGGIAPWREIPVSIIGDELNRSSVMAGGLKPLGDGAPFAGLALTVDCMVGDNSALHYALTELKPGQVIVADGRGHVETALWGDIMHGAAKARGAVAVVIDGAIRDRAEIAASGLPAYARGIVPRGPHKGWGGSVHAPIQCGGVPVTSGDLIVGDADGIAVIRPDQISGLYERCLKRIAKEAEVKTQIRAGKTTVEIFNFPPPERIGT
ncbi:MAG: RraA family protein [Hyphomicrobiaceae bacterium]